MTVYRDAAESDKSELIRLWSSSFGDPDDMVEDFLSNFGIGTGVAGIKDGKIVCAAYILPTGGIHLPHGVTHSCCYIYAVAVLPEYRGFGLGREITKEAVRISKERGFEFSVLKPSDLGLFDFYRKLGFADFSYLNELTFYNQELPVWDAKNNIAAVSAEEYLSLRERLLSETVHVIPSLAEILYQAKLGELYCLTLGQTNGCAAVEKYGDTAYIKELIIPENDIQAAVSLLSEIVPSAEYKVRVPVFAESNETPNGMISPNFEIGLNKPFLGLAFD